MTTIATFPVKIFKAMMPALKHPDPSLSRQILSGVHIFSRDGVLIFEATNSHITIRVNTFILNSDLDIVIPIDEVKAVIKALSTKDGVSLSFNSVYSLSHALNPNVYAEAFEPLTVNNDVSYTSAVTSVLDTFLVEDKHYGEDAKALWGFDLSYLALLSTSLKALDKDQTASFSYPLAPSHPTRLYSPISDDDLDKWQALIMPVQVDRIR